MWFCKVWSPSPPEAVGNRYPYLMNPNIRLIFTSFSYNIFASFSPPGHFVQYKLLSEITTASSNKSILVTTKNQKMGGFLLWVCLKLMGSCWSGDAITNIHCFDEGSIESKLLHSGTIWSRQYPGRTPWWRHYWGTLFDGGARNLVLHHNGIIRWSANECDTIPGRRTDSMKRLPLLRRPCH